jgi:hypothetical protein
MSLIILNPPSYLNSRNTVSIHEKNKMSPVYPCKYGHLGENNQWCSYIVALWVHNVHMYVFTNSFRYLCLLLVGFLSINYIINSFLKTN